MNLLHIFSLLTIISPALVYGSVIDHSSGIHEPVGLASTPSNEPNSRDVESEAHDTSNDATQRPTELERRRRRQEREEKRRQAERRRHEREENRRRRAERRRNRQRESRTELSVHQDGSHALPSLEWLTANLTALWEVVNELQDHHIDFLQRMTEPRNSNDTHFGDDSTSSCDTCEDYYGSEDRCRSDEHAPLCSAAGQCCCGECHCEEGYSGHYCDCHDTEGCPRHEGLVCGGNGECVCGSCVCHSGFTGPDCNCSMSTDTCRPPNTSTDAPLCSGHGSCQCGRCVCNGEHSGSFCESSPFSAGVCGLLKNCVLCQALGRTLPQCRQCSNVTVRRAPDLAPSHRRCRMVNTGCLIQYSYTLLDNGQYDVTVPEDLMC